MFSQTSIFLLPENSRRRLSESFTSLPHCRHNVFMELGSGRPAETSLLACKWLEVHRIKYSNRAECCRKLMKALLNLEVYTPF